MNIYVGNLSLEVNEKDLTGLFSKYGNVSSAKIIRDAFSQESRGFGFVEMPGSDEALKAVHTLNSSEFKGKSIIVNEAKPKKNDGGQERRKRF